MELRGRKQKTMMKLKPFPLLELPSELLLLHVLSRLQLKYLIRLRCVSKFFLDLTNNPNFITSYRKSKPPDDDDDFNFMDTTTITPSSLVVASSNEWQWPWRFHVLFKGSSFIYSQKRNELIPFHCPSHKRLIGSMNGLICFGGRYSLEIYNIIAGTNYNLIPSFFSPSKPKPRFKPWPPVFVFGYDPLSNDYKIIRIVKIGRCFNIYSFRTNSWKCMTLSWDYGAIFVNSDGGRSVCINGIIYWPLASREYPIVLLDLHKEKFSVIQLPEDLPEEDLMLPTQYVDIQLLCFRGCLAFAFIQRTSSTTTTTTTESRKLGDVWKPLSGVDVWSELFNRKKRGGVISEEAEKAIKNCTDVWTKILKSEEKEKAKARSYCGDIQVELFVLKNNNGGVDEADDEKKCVWHRESFVVPIPPPLKEVEIVSCCDEIFLGWFESNQLRLYNLHTRCLFNLPLSPPSQYYPKVSFVGEKENDPTYVDNLSFDFSLI